VYKPLLAAKSSLPMMLFANIFADGHTASNTPDLF
jgi:hypothetical protein